MNSNLQDDSAAMIDFISGIKSIDEATKNQELLKKQQSRKDFLEELRKTMLETQVESGGNGLLKFDNKGEYYLTQEGKLTDVFKVELQKMSEEQIKLLESKIVDLKPPQEDIFGIKRRFCQVCAQDCSGYQSSNFLFASSTQQRGEFPTFCKQCSCPAYFHKVCENQFKFPEHLADLVRANNIQSNDINWNCLMATFMLEVGSKSKTAEVIELLKEEGIEVISFSQRHLQSEEAFLLRSRIVEVQFEDQNKAFNTNFNKVSKDNEIKINIQVDPMEVNSRREQNPYFLEKASQLKESLMKGQMSQTQSKPSTRQNTEIVPPTPRLQASLKPSLQGENMLHTVIEEGDEDFERDMSVQKSIKTEVQRIQEELNMQNRILPLSARNARLMTTKSQLLNQKSCGIQSDVVDERDQIQFLVDCYQKNKFLQQLCQNEIVFLILSSSKVQNLSGTVKQVITKFDNLNGTRCLYFSQNKIQALEDCIQFVPHLFRLSKSIMVSEPLARMNEPRFNKDSFIGRLTSDFTSQEPMKSTVTHYSQRQAVGLQSKLTSMNRLAASQRLGVPTKDSRRDSVESMSNLSQESWVQRARGAVVAVQKQQALANKNNKILFNFGILRDFFNYSGMCVQLSHRQINFAKPPKPQGITGGNTSAFSDLLSDQPCNMFAIAKVGLPNLIMPNTLDLKLQNFENFDNYSRVADMFFPDLNVNSHTVIVLRPLIVRNELNNLFVSILRANEFLILKQVIRPLTAGETLYLFNQEQTSEENKALYFDIMMQGPCEILVVSKLSAVYDARTLFNGASPYGRRRMNQANEDTSNTRSAVDSVSSMFEVAPFTSFSELIDLEDFLCRNSKLHKFKQENEGQQPRQFLVQSDLEARERIKIFSRFFNFTGYCSPSIQHAQRDICTLTPEVAQLQEICLILNPIYNGIVEDAFELLIRQGFQIMQHSLHQMTEESVKQIYNDKFDFETKNGHAFMRQMTQERCHVLHLTKLAADLETRQLYRSSDLQVEDLLDTSDFGRPLKPVYMPYIFLYLDTPEMFELGLSLLYQSEHLNVSGRQMFHHRQQDVMSILQMCLLVTVGDTIKVLSEDSQGNAKSVKPLIEQFEPLHPTNLRSKNKPQFQLLSLDDQNGKAQYCAYQVESQSLGLFEVRFLTVSEDHPDLQNQFQSLSHFYKEASKVSSNIVPAFYFFKIAYNCNRVFEVEEFMGDKFIEKLARMHLAHQKIIQSKQLNSTQKSMPAYVFGTQLSQMCRKLQNIQTPIKGAGRFTYDQEAQFTGELPKVTESNYYFYDKQRYSQCLASFKKAWLYYISCLEADIIEMKLQIILDSLTFRYSRQPEFLKLVPERLNADHLRISEKIKVVNLEGLQDDQSKFFKADGFSAIYPNREQEISSKVESIMQTLKTHSSNKAQGGKDYSIHNDVAITGFQDGISRRPQTHLLASLLWIFEFEYRKVTRCEKYFVGDRDYKHAKGSIDKEYDEVLDIIQKACLADYHQDHAEALDIIKLKSNQGEHKTDLQQTMEAKQRLQDAMLKQMQDKVQETKRRARQTMSIQELIQTEIWDAADEAKKQQRIDLKEFLNRKGGLDRDGNEFVKFMEKSKMQFGPYATQLAESFIKKQSLQQLLQKNPQHKTQEFISFVRMEYFLYGIAEANNLVQQLKSMEDRINEMDNSFDALTSQVNQIQNQIACLPYEARFMLDRKLLTSQMTEVAGQRASVEESIYQFRLEISTKETELVMIFKELISCDFYVPEDHFMSDQNSMLAFKIPLTTFWKEVKIKEFIETDLNSQQYVKTVGAMPQLTTSNYGRFLAQSIRNAVVNEEGTQERIQSLAQGTTTSNLNDPQIVAKPDKIALARFSSHAEQQQVKDLERQDMILKGKQSKQEYKPDVFIQ